MHPFAMHHPVQVATGEQPHPAGGGPVAGAGRPLRIMIVEDEAIIAMDLEMTLEDLGAEIVCTADNAAEAFRLAKLYRPDCATMDISINGDRDGVSAAIELYENLGIRSIFVSAFGNPETRARAASANPIDWIGKPFSEADLKRIFDRLTQET